MTDKTYNLQDPVWNGEKWTGANEKLDLLDLINDLAIQMGQHEARLVALEGGDTEDV